MPSKVVNSGDCPRPFFRWAWMALATRWSSATRASRGPDIVVSLRAVVVGRQNGRLPDERGNGTNVRAFRGMLPRNFHDSPPVVRSHTDRTGARQGEHRQ